MSTTVIKWKQMQVIPQENTARCWLAAYQMMFQWKGKSIDWIFPLLANGSMGSDKATTAYEEGLDRPDWPLAAHDFGMTGVTGRDVSLDDITDLLGNGPLLVHGKFPLGMHSIVVIGTDDDEDQVGYINPYWSMFKEEVKVRWSGFSWLRDGIKKNSGFPATMQHW